MIQGQPIGFATKFNAYVSLRTKVSAHVTILLAISDIRNSHTLNILIYT